MEPDKETNAPENSNSSIKDESPEDNASEKNDEQQDHSAERETTDDSKPSDGEQKEAENKNDEDDQADQQPPDIIKVTDEIDQFISLLSSNSIEDGKEPPIIPDSFQQYAFLAEAKITNYDALDTPVKWNMLPEEESDSLLENVARIYKLTVSLTKFSSYSDYASTLNRFGGILQRALSFFEEEFRSLLEESEINIEYSSDPDPEQEPPAVNYFPGYSDEIIAKLNRLGHALISAGHETECCQLYFLERRKALEAILDRLGYEKNSIDDVQKKNWDAMERDIATWIKTYKEFSKNILPSEQNLIESVYAGHESASLNLFRVLSRTFLIQLLNFSEAFAMTKRSDEKLFKFVDVYEALRDLVPALDGLFPADDGVHELIKSDATLTRCKIGESIIFIFCELESKIKAESGKTPVPGGAVHPNTRYTLNYLKLACESKDTLEQVFKEHLRIERADSNRAAAADFVAANNQPSNSNEEVAVQSPFQLQLLRVMDSVDANLEGKSKLYKDPSLSLIFLMNNGRYILQKVKGSSEIKSLMGDPWIRKRSSDLRSYHKAYQRETWGKVLNCLNAEGLTVHGKVSKPALKEKFKNFNAMFDEIHKTQSTWVVTDEQLQSELRVSISSLVIPAYRSFMARFSSTFTPGRQTEKYVKFQPEDIETYIDELFDGSASSQTGKKR